MSEELQLHNTLDLRYMQVEMSLQVGGGLPGSNLPDSFLNSEFVTLIETTKSGMICYVKFEFNDASALNKDHGGLEILEIKSVTKNSALAKVLLNGPVAMMFCEDNEVWWVNPTYLNPVGLSLTIRGTRAGLTRIRESFSQLVGNGFSVKLGAESMHSPEFRDMLPHKQRIVLDKAIEMGYYSRPRGCTQRDIANAMNIKQATVSEHLQSAESKIINSIGI
ncbi:helix-turn-helix domain-containing protein [Candidatus Poseidoniaceae archaeon]|jgi:hypothetical protein|nr:helix-turn-helix domain-containing protein [Candidatus Poseidoniaceae archaeon]